MNGLEQVKEALSAALERSGLTTRTAYAPGWSKLYDTPVVAIGLRTGESKPGALSHYLGQRPWTSTRLRRRARPAATACWKPSTSSCWRASPAA